MTATLPEIQSEPAASSGEETPAPRRSPILDVAIVSLSCVLFLAIALYQLDLPGLYPDEAFDVIPTMQLLLGHPVELQRGAAIHIFGLSLPLMSSSDYQGITSTYFALPFFAVGGINVFSLRFMTVLWGVIAIVLAYFLAKSWFNTNTARITVLLLAVSPSWIFWSRIGVYVVSEVVPIAAGALLAFGIWVRRRPAGTRNGPLYVGIFLLGLGLTTKLLFLWLIVAVAGAAIILYARHVWDYRRVWIAQTKRWVAVSLASAGAFCLGAFPFLLYNAMTRGTLYVLRANAGSTTHGVDNKAVLRNLWTEADALRVLLDGSYFWFQGALGHVYFNPLTPALFALSCIALVATAVQSRPSKVGPLLTGPMRVALGVLAAALALTALLALGAIGGTLGSAALLLSTVLCAVASLWLLIVAFRDERYFPVAAWSLLVAAVFSGAVWWFGGSGRPEGTDPNGPLGLWPVDAAGALFWLSGAALVILLGTDRRPSPLQRPVTASLAIIGLVVAQSAVTVSGLWSTHLLLLIPLPQILIAAWLVYGARQLAGLLSRRTGFSMPRFAPVAAGLLLAALVVFDLLADYSYHRDLALTGGGSTFSDAIYRLADYLDNGQQRQVVAMDWGFKRPLQLLTEERVNPLDAYGYTAEATTEFRQGIRDLLADPNIVYLFHTPEGTAYPRFEAFSQEAAALGKTPTLVQTFYHRDGVPVYLIYQAK